MIPDGPGAHALEGEGCRFRVWAPAAGAVEVHLVAPEDRRVRLEPRERGYYEGVLDGIGPGARYRYVLDGRGEYPDPASRLQPEGVHGPSEVVASEFPWTDGEWRGLPLAAYIVYELHVGTFTPAGTFDGVIGRLDALRGLGVTALEVMPVAQFPGARNWGYDGVYPYAVHPAYGGPAGLKRLVDACHRRGLAVILDVVYNHLGPEGNYLAQFGPYFTDRYRTPWGDAMNFDGPGSDEVRRYVVDNACRWVDEFHADALRLDALHAIYDQSARHLFEELAGAVHARGRAAGRAVYVIAESGLNDPRLLRPPACGGYGLDADWSDDFHHALHVLLTGERIRYYADFNGLADLARAWTDGYVRNGRHSRFLRRRFGAPSRDIPAERLVVCAQNHDQVGNRALGERLTALIGFEALKLAAGAVLLSPFVPMLFMGEEYGETAPFLYFTDHGDPGLAEGVRRGRRAEYPESEPPDPQSPDTFARSQLAHDLAWKPHHRMLLEFYTELIRLRKTVPALAHLCKESMEVRVLAPGARAVSGVLFVRRWHGSSAVAIVFNFSEEAAEITAPLPAARWTVLIDSADARWGGPGSIRGSAAAVESDGSAELRLAPWSFVALSQGENG